MAKISKSVLKSVQNNAISDLIFNASKGNTQAIIWLIDHGVINVDDELNKIASIREELKSAGTPVAD